MIRITCAAAAATLLAIGNPVAASSAETTGLRILSSAGDFVGDGESRSYLVPDTAMTAYGNAHQARLYLTDADVLWLMHFTAPGGSTLRRGAYAAAAQDPFQSPMRAGLDISGHGRSCNGLEGWFEVKEYETDGSGAVTKMAVNFLQKCRGTGPPMYGALRLHSSFPLFVPRMAAIAGADFDALAGDDVTLDGTQSFTRGKRPLHYHWTQLAGPVAVLDDPESASPGFVAPEVGLDGDTLRFRLEVTTGTGIVKYDQVNVLVLNRSAPRTEIRFHGDPGDYVTRGEAYRFDSTNAVLDITRDYRGGVHASIHSDEDWDLDLDPPANTALAVQTYPNAQQYPYQDFTSPGLNLEGGGRACDRLTGEFTVYQAEFDAEKMPVKLDIEFVQRCNGLQTGARGELLVNAVPHETLAAMFDAAKARFGD